MLERAVEALGGSGDEATYNYALFNLASAYLGAGRAAEAIPLLEERMQFDDGQLGDVQAKLDEARAAAGVKPEKPEKSEKPGKGPEERRGSATVRGGRGLATKIAASHERRAQRQGGAGGANRPQGPAACWSAKASSAPCARSSTGSPVQGSGCC